MKWIGYIVTWIIPAMVYWIGLNLFGHEDILRLGLQLIFLATVSSIVRGIYNHFAFRASLENASQLIAVEYNKYKFPPPQKFGYCTEKSKMEKWYGQTYLEELCEDWSITELQRLRAQMFLKDIYEAERTDLIMERRLMKVAIEAMKKYSKMVGFEQSEGNQH